MTAPNPKILLTGTFDIKPLDGALRAWCDRFAWKHSVEIRDAVADPVALVDSGAVEAAGDMVSFLVVRPSDWIHYEATEAGASAVDVAAQAFSRRLLEVCEENDRSVIVMLAPPSTSTDPEAAKHARHVEGQLFASLSKHEHINICRSPEWMGAAATGDDKTVPLFPGLAMMAARELYQIYQPSTKLIIIHDRDTLWEGSPEVTHAPAIRAPHRHFQRALAGQREAGLILGVLTETDTRAAEQTAQDHPDMILKKEDIMAWQAFSNSPAEAVKVLAKEVGIPLSRVAFLSKDTRHVHAVRTGCPEVLSIRYPSTGEEVPSFLEHLWCFDRDLSTKDMGATRNRKDQEQAKRRLKRRESGSFSHYLELIGIQISQTSPSPEAHERMAELTQSSSLLNATSRRFSASEVKTWLGRPYHYATLFRAHDTFADHGVVGMIMFERVKRTLLVHNFLLDDDCLGLGIESRMLSELGTIATQHNCLDIDLPFLRTPANTPTESFLSATIESYQQDLPEDDWSVYQIPIKVATALAEQAPFETQSSELTQGEVGEFTAHSDTLEEIANRWRTMALDGYIQDTLPDIDPEPISSVDSEAEAETTKIAASPFTVVATDEDETKLITEVARVTLPPKSLPSDPFSLSSIQNWFFQQDIEGRDHWNQAFMLRLKERLDPSLIRKGLECIRGHHPVLQLRFSQGDEGWEQVASLLPDDDLLRMVDLSRASEEGIDMQVETIAAATQGRLNLREGILLRAVYFDLGPERHPRLLLVAHQLVTDQASWQILIHDLANACLTLQKGLTPSLPEPQSTYAEWIATQRENDAERGRYLDGLESAKLAPDGIPSDFENPGRNIEGSRETLSLSLTASETASLIQQCPNGLEASVLKALTHAIHVKGGSPTLAEWFWSGRAPSDKTTHMLGWCDRRGLIALVPAEQQDVTLTTIRRQQTVLEKLEGLGNTTRPELRPWIRYQHRSGMHEALANNPYFELASEDVGPLRSPRALRVHPVALDTCLEDGVLSFTWSFSRHLHERATIEGLASTVKRLMLSSVDDEEDDLAVTQRVTVRAHPSPEEEAESESLRLAEEARQRAEEEAKRKADEEAQRAAEEEARKAAAKAEADAKAKHEAEEAARQAAEAEAEARRLAEEQQKAEAAAAEKKRLAEEEARQLLNEPIERPALIVVSSDTKESVLSEWATLADQFALQSREDLPELAAIVATSRPASAFRSSLVIQDIHDLANGHQTVVPTAVRTPAPSLVFLFPDTFALHSYHGKGLYETEEVYREVVDWCSKVHEQVTGHDIRETLLNDSNPAQSVHADSALFISTFAQARLWMSWGLQPAACFGQGTGEYVAACLSGVFTLEEVLALLAKRSELIRSMGTPGMTLRIEANAREIKPFLKQRVDVAVYQSDHESIITGDSEAIAELIELLDSRSVPHTRLPFAHARQSAAMQAMEASFEQVLEYVDLREPRLPFLSGVTGDWISEETCCSPNYWASHLSHPLRVQEALQHLGEAFQGISLEIGPGTSLTQSLPDGAFEAFSGSPRGPQREVLHTAEIAGKLWENGLAIDWHTFHQVDEEPASPISSESSHETPDNDADAPEAENKPVITSSGARAAMELLADSLDDEPKSAEVVAELPTDSQSTTAAAAASGLLALHTDADPRDEVEDTANDPFPMLETDTEPSSDNDQSIASGNPPQLQERFEVIEKALDDLRSAVFPQATEPLERDLSLVDATGDYFEETLERSRSQAPKSQEERERLGAHTGGMLRERPEIITRRAQGSRVWDADDNAYIDVSDSLLTHWLGYQSEAVVRAIRDHIADESPESMSSLKLGIIDALRDDFFTDKITFVQSSKDALDLALSLAQDRGGRPGIGVISGQEKRFVNGRVCLHPEDPRLASQIFRRRHELAAILVDPLSLIDLEPAQRAEILDVIREETERCGMALILDERETAFRWDEEDGRSLASIRPDFAIYGESLSDGLPVGILARSDGWRSSSQDRLIASAPPLHHSLPLVAVQATIKSIQQTTQKDLRQWRSRTQQAITALQESSLQMEAPLAIRSLGCLFTIQVTKDLEQAWLLPAEALYHGLRLSTSRPNTTTLAHSDDDLDQFVSRFDESVNALQDRGFFLKHPDSYIARMAGKQDEQHLLYWTETLRNAKRHWPQDRHGKGPLTPKTICRQVPKTLLDALGKQAEAWGGDRDDLLCVAFHSVFSAWSGKESVTFLSEIDGQALPLVFSERHLTLRDALAAVLAAKEVANAHALSNQDRFQKWLAACGPGCGLGLSSPPAKLPLHWQVTRDQILCDYDANRFDSQTIERWIDSFVVLLQNLIAAASDATLADLRLVSDEVYETLVVHRNVTTTGAPPHEPVHRLFETLATKMPGRIAIRHGQEKVTYGELNARSDEMAQALIDKGIQPGDTVGVLMQASPRMIETWLAVLKVGAAYLPLDRSREPDLDRLKAANPALLLVQGKRQDWAAWSPGSTIPTLDIDAVTYDPDAKGIANLRSQTTRDDAAVVLYHWDNDSPEPVRLPHRALVRLVKNTDYATIGAHEIFLLGGQTDSDQCLLEVWGPLLNGGVLAIPRGSHSTEALAEAIATQRVSSLVLSGTTLAALMDEHADDLSWIRQIIIKGELPDPSVTTRVLQDLPVSLTVGYGPLENTFLTCSHTVSEEDLERETMPIGLPIPHTQVFVLNDAFQPVPQGMSGDLWVGGDGLALVQTLAKAKDSRWMRSPFPNAPGKLFCTGMKATWGADGILVEATDDLESDTLPTVTAHLESIRNGSSGDQAPLVLVAMSDGESALLREAAELLPDGNTIHLLHADLMPEVTIEEAAAICWERLQEEGLSQNLTIGGGPLGGILGYEMAQQAVDLEIPMDGLILAGTHNPCAEDAPDVDHPAVRNYVPRAYPGNLTLMRPGLQATKRQLGWDGLARGGFTVASIAKLTPHSLGKELGKLLHPKETILS